MVPFFGKTTTAAKQAKRLLTPEQKTRKEPKYLTKYIHIIGSVYLQGKISEYANNIKLAALLAHTWNQKNLVITISRLFTYIEVGIC